MTRDFRDKELSVYLNRSRKDKIPSTGTKSQWKAFHAKWIPQDLTARELAIEVYRGNSIAHLHNGRKMKDNWLSAGYIALDFDTGDERSSLEYLAERDYINWFASFGYTTPSHTAEKPRARIVWILETAITDFKEYTELYKAMLHKFPWADQSTKDVARFFWGSLNCTVWGNWSLLFGGAAAELTRLWREENPPPPPPSVIPVPAGEVPDRYLTAVRDGLLTKILTAPDGEKHNTLNKIAYVFGGYVAGGYFIEGDVLSWLDMTASQLPNVSNLPAAYQTIRQGIVSGKNAPLSIERPASIEERNGRR
jgi:hypothetical protein